ncbi:MAG: ORF6N domain-containing protein [Bacteroidales bacterium]|nr:ORF6N domain-containing protein [Bacteroidales bacterium]
MENFHHLEKLRFSPQLPKVFTEKGLYMLATIIPADAMNRNIPADAMNCVPTEARDLRCHPSKP